MDKIKEGTSLSIVFADWCEMTGVSPSLFVQFGNYSKTRRIKVEILILVI